MKFTKRNILKNKKKQETKTKRNKHKITKKRVNKLKTTSKKIGGQHPKINYAYTYLIFNYQDYKKYIFSQPSANIFILNKANNCICLEINSSVSCNNPTETSNTPILNNDNEYLILVMKYRNMVAFSENLKKNINLFNNPSFLNEILGSSIIRQYLDTKIVKIGIYSICLYIKQGQGYGTVLFNIILHAINSIYTSMTDPNTTINLCLGIRLDNPNFKKLVHLYTSFGFKNPFVSSKHLNGQPLSFKIMELSKEMDDYVTNEDTTYKTFLETIDIYKQTLLQTKTCKFKFMLDRSAILNLRLMPYLNTSGKLDNILNNNVLNNEYSGSLFIYNASQIGDDIYYKLSLETIQNDKGIHFNKGNKEAVEIIPDQRTYHTHPILAYVKYKRLVGFPSGGDFAAVFLLGFNEDIQFQFHMVITIEGIYILSLSEKAVNKYNEIPNIKEGVSWMLNNPGSLQYDPELKYDWISEYSETNNSAKDVSLEIQKFFEWLKKINDEYMYGLIECKFYFWKEIDKNTKFEVFYHKSDNNSYCYPSKITREIDVDIPDENKMDTDL